MPTPERDPVIDEIRERRHRISAEVNHDPVQLVERYRRMQEQYADRLLKQPAERSPQSEPAA
jgi:hypothetical protein